MTEEPVDHDIGGSKQAGSSSRPSGEASDTAKAPEAIAKGKEPEQKMTVSVAEGTAAVNRRDDDGQDEADDEDEDDDEEEESEDDDGGDEDEEEDEDEDEDEEPRLKYARLTQHLGGVYRNGDATSASLVAGDKMVGSTSI
jgi:vacuolar protein sorting-associated protein 41